MNLPPLPPSGEKQFCEYEANQMHEYGQQCAQHALQMAAEAVRLGQGPRSSAESAVRSLMK